LSSLAYDILPLNKEILKVVQELAGDEGYLPKSAWRHGLTYEQLRKLDENSKDTVATFLFHQG
jgi:hypothetical protein